MRSLLQLLAGLSLLVSQVVTPPRLAATALPVSAGGSTGVKQLVTLNTSSAQGVTYMPVPRPDFDKEVLDPLRAAQAQAAAKAAATKLAAQKAAAARAAALRAAAPVQLTAAVTGDPATWMAEAGVSSADFGYVSYIATHEGRWDPCEVYGGAHNCSYYGSLPYGLFQAKPAYKMAAFGADWQTNPVTQIRWAQAYAIGCYGSWYGAYRHWLAYHSW